MVGVILCGGQSSRMGTDKGLLKQQGKAWVQIGANKLSSIHLTVLVSVNAKQYHYYQPMFRQAQLIKDNEVLQIRGPLAGILSSHTEYPEEDLFVLACDMPLMEINILSELLIVYQENPVADAYIFTDNGVPEPLCAIYTAKGLDYIMHLLQSQELRRYSMQFFSKSIHFPFDLQKDKNNIFRTLMCRQN